MKLETSEGERAELTAWCTMKTEEWKSGFAPELTEQTVWAKTARLLRDIDTLLAEVERLRAERRPFSDGLAQKVIDEQIKTIDRLLVNLAAAAPPAPPLPAEVEEMRKKLDGPHEWGYRCLAEGPFFISDPAPFDAASLLSRWPGVWRPIETAPKMKTIMLFAVTDRSEDGSVKNWKMETGFWHSGFVDHHDMSPWQWCGRQLATYDVQPTHWSPLPEPPHE